MTYDSCVNHSWLNLVNFPRGGASKIIFRVLSWKIQTRNILKFQILAKKCIFVIKLFLHFLKDDKFVGLDAPSALPLWIFMYGVLFCDEHGHYSISENRCINRQIDGSDPCDSLKFDKMKKWIRVLTVPCVGLLWDLTMT